MNTHDDYTKKIAAKAEELHKVEADRDRLTAAVTAADSEHVESLIAAEMEQPDAAKRVRKAKLAADEAKLAMQDLELRRKTLIAVISRLDTEAKKIRRADLDKLRIEAAGEVQRLSNTEFMTTLSNLRTIVNQIGDKLEIIRESENELDGLVQPLRVNRLNTQSPVATWMIDLGDAARWAVQIHEQNAPQIERVRTEPTHRGTEISPGIAPEPVAPSRLTLRELIGGRRRSAVGPS